MRYPAAQVPQRPKARCIAPENRRAFGVPERIEGGVDHTKGRATSRSWLTKAARLSAPDHAVDHRAEQVGRVGQLAQRVEDQRVLRLPPAHPITDGLGRLRPRQHACAHARRFGSARTSRSTLDPRPSHFLEPCDHCLSAFADGAARIRAA